MSDWIKNTGECPVEKGVLVDVKYRDGQRVAGIPALIRTASGRDATSEFWCLEEMSNDILSWRLSESESETVLTIKDTNPKEQIGLSKLPLHLWSPLASAYGSLGLLNGLKYGLGNYKATPVLASIYIAAIKRHLSAWEEGQECDPLDGVPHFGAILANVAILLESRSVGTMVDDRQIRGGYLKEVDKLTKIANSVQELHKDRKPYHYSINDTPQDV